MLNSIVKRREIILLTVDIDPSNNVHRQQTLERVATLRPASSQHHPSVLGSL
jgi:hypothetical protein